MLSVESSESRPALDGIHEKIWRKQQMDNKKNKIRFEIIMIIIILLIILLIIIGPIILNTILGKTTEAREYNLEYFQLENDGIDIGTLTLYYITCISIVATTFLGLISYKINKDQYNLINRDKDLNPELHAYCKRIEVHYPFEQVELIKNDQNTEGIKNAKADNIEDIFFCNNVNEVFFHLPVILYNDNPNNKGIPIHEIELLIYDDSSIINRSTTNSVINRTMSGHNSFNMTSEWFNYQYVDSNDAIDKEFEFKFSNTFKHNINYMYNMIIKTKYDDYTYEGEFKYFDFRIILLNSKGRIEDSIYEYNKNQHRNIRNKRASIEDFLKGQVEDYGNLKLSNSYDLEFNRFDKKKKKKKLNK